MLVESTLRVIKPLVHAELASESSDVCSNSSEVDTDSGARVGDSKLSSPAPHAALRLVVPGRGTLLSETGLALASILQW